MKILFISAALAGAVVAFKAHLEKLTPVVKPLMSSLRQETNECLQKIAAEHLALLLEHCQYREPSPNDKILANLCTILRCDPEFTPSIHKTENDHGNTRNSHISKPSNYNGIVTLSNQQRNAEKALFKRSNSTGRGPGRPPTNDISFDEIFKEEDEQQRSNQIQCRGATLALIAITKHFRERLPFGAPKLWDYLIGDLSRSVDPYNFNPNNFVNKDEEAEKLVWSLQVMKIFSNFSQLTSNSFDYTLFKNTITKSHRQKTFIQPGFHANIITITCLTHLDVQLFREQQRFQWALFF